MPATMAHPAQARSDASRLVGDDVGNQGMDRLGNALAVLELVLEQVAQAAELRGLLRGEIRGDGEVAGRLPLSVPAHALTVSDQAVRTINHYFNAMQPLPAFTVCAGLETNGGW